MDFISGLIVIFSCLLTLCQTQSYSYSAQRRAGYGYSQPSYSSNYYSQPKPYYQSTASKTSSYYNNPSKTSYANSQYKQSLTRNSYPYSSSSSGYYNSYKAPTTTTTRQTTARPFSQSVTTSSPNYSYRNSFSSSSSKGSFSSASDPYNSKKYLSNSYNSETYQKDNKSKTRISKADAENAKFAGAANQEDEEDSPRTAHLKRRKLLRRYGGLLSNPCIPFGREAGKSATPPPKEQGRILWDVNVYNIYPQTSAAIGCGGYGGIGGGVGFGYGGGFGGGGLLADPIAPVYYPPGAGISNFLRLFAPGILQNSLAVTARPPQYADYNQASNGSNDSQNDPNVDPNFDPAPAPAPVPVRRPNRVYYDSAGAPPVTPGQLVGGISTTVNGIIQQLTGNVQPVYG